MWQNPLLPPHLFFQALLLGSAVLLIAFVWVRGLMVSDGVLDTVRPEIISLTWTLAITSLVHLLMVWGEVSLTHPTAHARLAIWELVRGRYKVEFWTGVTLSLLGGLVPSLAVFHVIDMSLAVAGAPLALVGMMLFEHAYVQAGQSVPLA
jgi:Ni/Fe-hydrogenase subunit HybB-like protein